MFPNWLITLLHISLGAVLVSLVIILAVSIIGLIKLMKELW